MDKFVNCIDDIYGMVDYIFRFEGVDFECIGLLGICGGGGYVLKVV